MRIKESLEKIPASVSVPTTIFLLTIIIVIIMAALGLFDFSPTEGEAKVIAAALALVGVLFTASITLIGYLLKVSFDNRSLELKIAGEDRLRLETAIRSVELLKSDTEGAEVSTTLNAGALFTLASLGQLKFALALLNQMITTGSIDCNSADWLINEVLESDEDELHLIASGIYRRNVEQFITETGFLWPDAMNEWNLKVNLNARASLIRAAFQIILLRPKDQWDSTFYANWMNRLYRAFKIETDDALRYHCAQAIIHIAKVPKFNSVVVYNLDEPTRLPSVLEEVEEHIKSKVPDLIYFTLEELLMDLKLWASVAD